VAKGGIGWKKMRFCGGRWNVEVRDRRRSREHEDEDDGEDDPGVLLTTDGASKRDRGVP
jgi:hypothetical protein